MKKVRLADIAREAKVGTATVERVLNARGNVSPRTVDKVIQAARRLGIPPSISGADRMESLGVRMLMGSKRSSSTGSARPYRCQTAECCRIGSY